MNKRTEKRTLLLEFLGHARSSQTMKRSDKANIWRRLGIAVERLREKAHVWSGHWLIK